MRDLSILVEAAAKAEQGKLFCLLELDFNTTLRYTDCDVPLYKETTVSGVYDEFVSMPFTIGNINYSAKASVDKLKIDIQNVDLTMSAVLLNEDTLNKWGTVWVAFLDDNNEVMDEPLQVFHGLVSTWEINEEKGSLTLTNEFVFWNKKTLRKHQASCRWQFKGLECGYSGTATSCDQSFARCTALANSDNYGGFRWLPALMEREIHWGRTY